MVLIYSFDEILCDDMVCGEFYEKYIIDYVNESEDIKYLIFGWWMGLVV